MDQASQQIYNYLVRSMLQAIYRGEEWDSNPRNRPGSRRLLPNAFGDKPKVAAAHHSLRGRGQQESPLLTVQPTGTDDPTRFVDVTCFGQDPARSAWDEPVQIAHDTRRDNDGAG